MTKLCRLANHRIVHRQAWPENFQQKANHSADVPSILPDITGRTALAVRPDVVNAKYHVITNATYNRDPVPAKFKHVTNIDTCTLLVYAVIIARCGKLCM